MAKKKYDNFNYSGYNDVKQIVENLISEWKKAGKISDGISRLSYDEAGVPLIEGVAVAIKEHAYEATEAMEKAMKEVDVKLKTGAISSEEYYKYMELYRNNFLEKGSLAWWQYTEKIMKYESSLNENLKKELEERKNEIVQAYSSVISEASAEISELGKLENKIQSGLNKYVESFFGKTVTFKNIGEDVLKNGIWNMSDDLVYKISDTEAMKNASEALGAYYDMLMRIKNSEGVPIEFFEMLRGMPVNEAISLSENLLTGGEENFYEYIRNWESLNKDIREVTDGLLSEEINEILTKFGNIGENLKSDLNAALGELPEDFFKSGELSGDAFSNGFLSRLNRVTERINEINSRISDSGAVTYNNASYNFYASGESVSAQLEAARNAETVNKLRG